MGCCSYDFRAERFAPRHRATCPRAADAHPAMPDEVWHRASAADSPHRRSASCRLNSKRPIEPLKLRDDRHALSAADAHRMTGAAALGIGGVDVENAGYGRRHRVGAGDLERVAQNQLRRGALARMSLALAIVDGDA